MNVTAEVKLTIEVLCPFCRSYSRFHDLDATTSNMRRWLSMRLQGTGDAHPKVEAKCQSCSKRFTVTAVELR